jgi:hypothetical protein
LDCQEKQGERRIPRQNNNKLSAPIVKEKSAKVHSGVHCRRGAGPGIIGFGGSRTQRFLGAD